MDHVADTVSDKTGHQTANISTRLRRVYPSRTGLKFVTFTVHRDSEDEDVDNNIHPPSPLKSANDKTKFVQ
jgi:hypothetical protein